MKPVKITQKQLRSLIKEAIQHKPLGEAEELVGNFPLIEEVTNAFQTVLDKEWPFDPNDPDMVSEEDWNAQKDGAVQQFMNDVSDVIESVVGKLIQGEYHRG